KAIFLVAMRKAFEEREKSENSTQGNTLKLNRQSSGSQLCETARKADGGTACLLCLLTDCYSTVLVSPANHSIFLAPFRLVEAPSSNPAISRPTSVPIFAGQRASPLPLHNLPSSTGPSTTHKRLSNYRRTRQSDSNFPALSLKRNHQKRRQGTLKRAACAMGKIFASASCRSRPASLFFNFGTFTSLCVTMPRNNDMARVSAQADLAPWKKGLLAE
ncbi:hypothetical protein B0T20DRAFT_324385, partial [Sordaria brevicollis]